MIGLGWHETVMGSWIMFMLASVEQKNLFVANAIPRSISSAVKDMVDEETPQRPTQKRRRLETPPSAQSFGFCSELMPPVLSDSDDEPNAEPVGDPQSLS